MITPKPPLARGLAVGLLFGILLFACQGPEEFFRTDGGLSGLGGSPPGAGGNGTGGEVATGGITGTGGAATGGITGTGGTHTGGVTGTGGTATGGITGTGGTHTGGVTGTGGKATGGVTGTGGKATGGVTGTGGKATGGVTGTGGKAAGGATGTGGAAGAMGTGPCAGLCSPPTAIPADMNSGALGTTATCQEVTGGTINAVTCGNFASPRTFSVNGMSLDCVTGGSFTLPAEINGGYCMQAGAGNFSYAYYATFKD
jgi:hypothetical protein